MENEVIFVKYNVTCKTENCLNSNVPIIVNAPEDGPFVICGVCAVKITDISRLTEEEIAAL